MALTIFSIVSKTVIVIKLVKIRFSCLPKICFDWLLSVGHRGVPKIKIHTCVLILCDSEDCYEYALPYYVHCVCIWCFELLLNCGSFFYNHNFLISTLYF